ncbi:MAG: corrinoid protein [Desulfatirhabdiaceae bacterium]|nr:corrinoid protein [Desulfatirhabdiaceae bacterium]
MTPFQPIIDALLDLNKEKVITLVRGALDNQVSAKDILNLGLIAGMDVVGERMEKEDMFIPEVLQAAQIMGAAVEILKPLLGEDSASANGRVVIGTVMGDLHDIGKNLVSMMIESAGLEVHDLGVNISPERFVEAIKNTGARILCMSALLTTTMPMMQRTIEALTESGMRNTVKIMVGGAPVTQKFANEIGADAYASDAGGAAKAAKALVQT